MLQTNRAVVALLMVLTLALAACGGDDAGDADEPTEEGAAQEDASTDGGDGADAPDDAAAEEGDAAGEEPTGEPVVFGMVEDASGGAAAYSQVAAGAVELAIAEINAAGGVLGRPIELRRENDQNEPSQAPALVRRLVESGAHVIVMNSGSASAVQAKPVCVELQVVCLAPTNLSTEIATAPDNEYSFILANPITDIADLFLEAFAAADIQSVAVLADDSPTIEGIQSLLVPVWEEAGLEIAADEKVPLDATDVNAQIARIRDSGADAMYFGSLGGQLEVVVQNTMAQQLPDMPRFSLASIGNQPEAWALADPGALDGLLFASSYSTENPRGAALADALREEQGDEFIALTAYHMQGYDAAHLLALAIENAGSTDDTAAIRDGMEQISGYQPTFGQPDFTITFTPDKHVGTDGLCGLVIGQFTAENVPGDPWPVYQPTC